ncbi:MAG: hypothetical protein HRU33_20955 [Rhodobacteraceae bacterium]|nr:hypothetical protein [Paracoccaceae bacterium]
MLSQSEGVSCTPAAGVQLRREVGEASTPKEEPFGLHAPWLHFVNKMEIRRLAKLHMRIKRKKAALSELIGQRQTIMNRCIKRMRRAGGRN